MSRVAVFARVALPVGLVVATFFAPALAAPVLVALIVGAIVLRARSDEAVWLWAAIIPLAVRELWEFVVTAAEPTLGDCGNVLSAPAVQRVVEALVVLGSLAAVALWLRADWASLSLRWPAGPWARLTIAAAVASIMLIPVGLLIGPALAKPFFGDVGFDLGVPAAILPAMLLALANSAMEEVEFRGALLGWGGRAIGVRAAIVLQAALFGVGHVGRDFLNPAGELLVLSAVFAAGLVAAVVVRRTGSLLLPIAVHLALDVPLYYAFACRLPT